MGMIMEKLTVNKVKKQLNIFLQLFLTKEEFVHAIKEEFNILLENCLLIWEDNRKILVVFEHEFGDRRIVVELVKK